MPLTSGAEVGPYEIIRRIGSGGMGEVWLATEVRLGRKVALKLLPEDLMADAPRVARLEQEARAASALNHPNVCTILALGETADGLHYIAMEYVEGETLRECLTTSRFSIRESLDTAIQIASALTVAHSAGIVHRDIKPENVMLRRDGLVKVMDFGLAKLTVATEASDIGRTQTGFHTADGLIIGTIAYMSPEQARGLPVDARTDIWSLGAILYEMVTGRAPFAAATNSDVLAAILERDPLPIMQFEPQVPAELQRIVTKALRKNSAQRYQTTQDFGLDLQALRDELQLRDGAREESRASRGTLDGRARRAAATRRIAITAALLTLVVAGLGAWWWFKWRMPVGVVNRPSVQHSLARLTFEPGLQTEPTWSPDGRLIAYASDRAGNFDIWTQAVAGGAPVQLARSPAHDTEPTWSPDGRSIVFRSERDGGGLFLISAFGGPERQLSTFGRHPQWMANGTEIIFTAGPGGTGWVSLYVVSPEGGGSPREILREFLHEGDWDWISSHPDGRISALGRHSRSGPGFFTLSRDGRYITRSEMAAGLPLPLQEGSRTGQGTRVVRFVWNATGTTLYVEALVNEVRNLWRVHVEPKTLTWRSAERLTAGAGADIGAALSRDGTRIVFTMQRIVSRLWAFPFDAAAGRLTGDGTLLPADDGTVDGSDLSPDGERAVYTLRRAGSQAVDLWVVHIRSGARELLAQNGVSPCWSRDARSIAYTLFRPSPGEWALAKRTLSGPERLLGPWSRESAFLCSDWTVDGAALLGSYVAPLSSPAVLALWPSAEPAPKPQRIVMAAAPRHLYQGRISPDGRWVSFVAGRQGGTGIELMVAPASGAPSSQWTRVAADHAFPDKPRWSPAGKTLYFLSSHGGAYVNLWGVRFDPARGLPVGAPFAITRFDSPGQMISPRLTETELGISARRALFTFDTVTGGIWMLENVER